MKRYFWPLPPKGAHKSFRIMSIEDGRREQVKDPRLDSVNKLYRAGTLDFQGAQKQVGDIVSALREKERPVSPHQYGTSDYNQNVADKWLATYSSRDIQDGSRHAMRASIRRALNLLGDLPISSASTDEVQRRVFQLPYPKRAHIVLALNALFRSAGRPHRFQTGTNREIAKVRYLTVAEFKKVAAKIKSPIVKLAAGAAFASGCRVGELFSLSKYEKTARLLHIDSQIDRKFQTKPTKTYRQRTAVAVAELEMFLTKWLAVPQEKRLSIRNTRLSAVLIAACEEAFPGRAEKRCHFYDLRHSYAVHFLSKGASIDLIAAALGHDPAICRRHYTGFTLPDEGAALLNRLQNATREKRQKKAS